jgi:hypothetical protein
MFIIDNASRINELKQRVDNIEAQVYVNCATHDNLDERVRLLEYRTIDLELRSRTNNLLLSGFPEEIDEDIISDVKGILYKCSYPGGISTWPHNQT